MLTWRQQASLAPPSTLAASRMAVTQATMWCRWVAAVSAQSGWLASRAVAVSSLRRPPSRLVWGEVCPQCRLV